MAKCPQCSSPSVRKSRKQNKGKAGKNRFYLAFRCHQCGTRFDAPDSALIGGLFATGLLGISLLVLIGWLVFADHDPSVIAQAPQTRSASFDAEPSPTTPGYRLAAGGSELSAEADEGSPVAQHQLALRFFEQYERSNDPVDLRNAHKLLLKSATQGHPQAQAELGNSYLSGRGVVQDFPQAADWFQKAAQSGVADAMYELGKMSKSGWGMEKSLVNAYVWLNLASARGDIRAPDSRSQLLGQLSNEELTEAQRRSRELDESIPKI